MDRESEVFVFVPLPWVCMNLYSKFTPFTFFLLLALILFSPSFLVIFFEPLCCSSGILPIDSRTI
jgi:hypothetical protein